jgi:hypothetical protein
LGAGFFGEYGMALSREQILSNTRVKTEKIDVPELGGEVFLRVMTGTERDEFDKLGYDPSTGKANGYNVTNYRACYASYVIAKDENGERMFGPQDVPALGQLPGSALERILGAGMVLNGMSGASLQELEKNSEDAPSDGSGSD